jgi:hypothetical protein
MGSAKRGPLPFVDWVTRKSVPHSKKSVRWMRAGLCLMNWSVRLRHATTKHRLRIIDRITDLFATGSRNYSYEL